LSTVAELEAIIDVLRADNPNVTILLAQLIPSAESGPNNRINQLNAEIPGIVSRKTQSQSPVYLVDQNTGFLLSDLRDNVHPSLSGQQKMAAKWFETLEVVLNTSDTTAPTIRQLKGSNLVIYSK
jgi:lysophospholipase L1-like esterase